MVAPNNNSGGRRSASSSGGGGGGHNSTHRLLIEISFFIALLVTFYQYHIISIHDLQHKPCDSGGGGGGSSGELSSKKNIDRILNAVSKLERKISRLETAGIVGSDGQSITATNNTRKNKNRPNNEPSFCGHCLFNDKLTCQERVDYLMQQYGIVQTVARTQEDVKERCRINMEDEPWVLIHPGPHKTGTTAIRSLIYQSESVLKLDNIVIPKPDDLPGIFKGIGPMLNLAHCMISNFVRGGGQMNVDACNKLRDAFTPFLKEAYENQQNVLLVAEDFDRLKEIDLRRLLFYLRPYKRIKIVTAYRRLHDWLPSWYNQIVDLYMVVYVQGKEEYPSLVDWMETKYDQFKAKHTMNVADFFRESGITESVDVLNMHDHSVPMLENFFCNYVPGAETMCQAVKEGQKPTKENKGSDHEFDRVAVKAYQLKKIPKLDRYITSDVGAAIKKAAEERGLIEGLPSKCINQTILDDLFNTELSQEKEYFRDFFEAQGGEEGLRKDFEEKKHKFCALDVNQILDEGTFDPIFEELSKDWKFQAR